MVFGTGFFIYEVAVFFQHFTSLKFSTVTFLVFINHFIKIIIFFIIVCISMVEYVV